MKFSLKDTITFALRFPLDHCNSLTYPIMYSAIVLAGIMLLAASGVSILEGVPFKDFGVRGPALSSMFATSMPLSELLLIPLEVAVILYIFKGKNYKQDFVSIDIGVKSAWYMIATVIYLAFVAGPIFIYHYFLTLYPNSDFLVLIVLGFPAFAATIFFMLTLAFIAIRTVLGHKIDIMENIELTKDHLFPIFLVIVFAFIGLGVVRVVVTTILNLFFSLLPAFIVVFTTAIITTAVDIIFLVITTAAVCSLYSYVANEKMKIGSFEKIEKK